MEGDRDDYVPHGFHSSFRDWSGEVSSFPRDVAEMALAHVIENRVEAAYPAWRSVRQAPPDDAGVGRLREPGTGQTPLMSTSDPHRGFLGGGAPHGVDPHHSPKFWGPTLHQSVLFLVIAILIVERQQGHSIASLLEQGLFNHATPACLR